MACEYCNGTPKPVRIKAWERYAAIVVILDEPAELHAVFGVDDMPVLEFFEPIKFCPMCGRELRLRKAE